MMCDFIARTNWSNIKSNYFVDTIIIFDLSYYTNITITVHSSSKRCCAVLFCQRITHTSPVPSSTLVCTCLIFPQKFLTAPTSLTMWSGRPSFKMNLSKSHMAEWIIFAVTGISVCSPLFKTPFATVMLDGFLSSIKGSSSTNWLPFPSFYFWTWCDKQCCQAQLRHSNRGQWFFVWGRSSGKLIIIKINETQLSWKQQSCQKCKHRQSHFDFLNTAYWVSFFKRLNLLAKTCFS